VIVATQMLESMTTNPVPTRARGLGRGRGAIFQGVDAVMLVGRSRPSGKYPVEFGRDDGPESSARVERRTPHYRMLLDANQEVARRQSGRRRLRGACARPRHIVSAKATITYTSFRIFGDGAPARERPEAPDPVADTEPAHLPPACAWCGGCTRCNRTR